MSRTPSTSSSTRTFMSPQPSEPETPKKVPRQRLRVGRFVPWLVILVLLAISIFLFVQYREAKHKLSSKSPAVAAAQVSSIITNVRKLVVVPATETPTVATVQNVSKLQGQTFFKNAHNGDKVLVYTAEKEAILYRPSSNQIVTIAPITLNADGATSLSSQ